MIRPKRREVQADVYQQERAASFSTEGYFRSEGDTLPTQTIYRSDAHEH
jgi:hypothetical protein